MIRTNEFQRGGPEGIGSQNPVCSIHRTPLVSVSTWDYNEAKSSPTSQMNCVYQDGTFHFQDFHFFFSTSRGIFVFRSLPQPLIWRSSSFLKLQCSRQLQTLFFQTLVNEKKKWWNYSPRPTHLTSYRQPDRVLIPLFRYFQIVMMLLFLYSTVSSIWLFRVSIGNTWPSNTLQTISFIIYLPYVMKRYPVLSWWLSKSVFALSVHP